MDYWNNIQTEKSWNVLQELKKLKETKFDFIVIGGWAAFLWTNLHKSKDIDIVIKDYKDIDFLKKNYNLNKNDNLKKYEIKIDEIDIDIYVPFYSRLAIPCEDIKKYATKIQGFEVVKPEILLILKQGAEKDRESSVKGEKDRIDIMTLLMFTEINFKEYFSLLKRYNLEEYYSRLRNIINNFKAIKYLDINPREFKIRKNKLIENLKKI